MNTHKFSLDDNYYILIEKTIEGKNIYRCDNILGDKKLMGTLSNSCKWIFSTPQVQRDFFKMVTKYKDIFMNNFYKSMEDIHEITFSKQITCFRRRLYIKVGRTLNKLKHVI